jgi:RNA polymerase sigma-70 factor (ECF subfamily)
MELPIEEIRRIYEARRSSFVLAAAALLKDREAANDVVQEGFAQALVARHKWRGGSAEAWIWRIVQRKALDQIRRRRFDVSLDKEFDARGFHSENHSGLAEAVAALPPRRRTMIFLHYFADLAYPDIAKLCGVSDGTVAATLAQARAELYGLLDKEVSP